MFKTTYTYFKGFSNAKKLLVYTALAAGDMVLITWLLCLGIKSQVVGGDKWAFIYHPAVAVSAGLLAAIALKVIQLHYRIETEFKIATMLKEQEDAAKPNR